MFAGAVCQWHTFSTDRSGAETLRKLLCSGAIRRHMKIATHPRSIIHEFQQMELT